MACRHVENGNRLNEAITVIVFEFLSKSRINSLDEQSLKACLRIAVEIDSGVVVAINRFDESAIKVVFMALNLPFPIGDLSFLVFGVVNGLDGLVIWIGDGGEVIPSIIS